jgi:hypothetical protein
VASSDDPRTGAREAVDSLVDANRLRCLWFLRADYYPSSDEERERVLLQIERHGDRDAYRRARELRRWLSPRCNDRSAAS